MKRGIPAISCVLVVLAALAGCGSDPKPIEPSAAGIPTAAASATNDTPEGRAAYIAHWIDLVNFTAMTGDMSPLLAASDGCRECAELARTSAKVRFEGERPREGIWRVRSMSMVSTDGTRFVVHFNDNSDLGVRAFDLGIVLPAKPPFHVIDIGRLE